MMVEISKISKSPTELEQVGLTFSSFYWFAHAPEVT